MDWIELLLMGLGLLVFGLLPLAAALTGTYRRTTAGILLLLAVIFLVFALAAERVAWEGAATSGVEREAFLQGAAATSRAARSWVLLLGGSLFGLGVIALSPPAGKSKRDDDA